MKKIILMVAPALVCLLAFGHEFWLQPLRFMLKPKETVSIQILRGEGFKGERSDGTKYKIQMLRHYSVQGSEDFTSHVEGADLSTVNAAFDTEGNHLMAFNNTSKFIDLAPQKFNSYLLEEGLENAYDVRMRNNDTNKNGRELYQRCAKTLFQVGAKMDSSFSIKTGMRLELVPLENPYGIKDNGQLGFQVWFDQQPLKGALLLVWNVVGNKTTMVKYRSDAEGKIHFPVTRNGRWMVSTVRMVPHTNPAEADWQSYWGSFTFGFQ